MSHAQALLTRLSNAISALEREVPAPPAETFAQAVELLQSAGRALSRAASVDINASAQSEGPGWPAAGGQRSSQHEVGASHPDLEAWLASRADTVTGEVDRRRVPISDLLTAGDFFVVDVGTVSRGAELRSRIAEALYLVCVEATMWSAQTRALAMALVQNAENELAERCHR